MNDHNFEQLFTASVSNLDWLDVDEKAYREMDTLPKQNLSIGPDLERLWGHTDSTGLVPNSGAPRTMLDLAPKGPRDPYPEAIRVARLLMMQSETLEQVTQGLVKRFPRDILAATRDQLASVLSERGLLGRYYIAASDFPRCAKNTTEAASFAASHAKSAKYVVRKDACEGCTNATGSHCGVFQKQLVPVAPFSEADAVEVERYQGSRGLVASTGGATPRDRIRAAYLAEAPVESGFTGMPNHGLVPVSNLLRKAQDPAEQARQVEASRAAPVLAALKREMLKGRTQAEVAAALKLSFDAKLLLDTTAQWQPLYRQAGAFGTVYTTQDSFADCREGADFLARHSSKVRAVVAGSKCSGCQFSKAGACSVYHRRLVASADEVLTPDSVRWVLDSHRMAGTLPWDADQSVWGPDPLSSLQAIQKAASQSSYVQSAPQRALVERNRQAVTKTGTSSLVTRDLVRVASQMLNEGLYGRELLAALQIRFDKRDLIASKEALKTVLAEQGLQGIYYVDPTAYSDYGSGCREAARLHRARPVKVAKAGPKCGGCMAQQTPGRCSILAKQLVAEPTYEPSREAVQRAVLASGSMSVEPVDLINNGANMLAEFQMQQASTDIVLDDVPVGADQVSIEFGTGLVDL